MERGRGGEGGEGGKVEQNPKVVVFILGVPFLNQNVSGDVFFKT